METSQVIGYIIQGITLLMIGAIAKDYLKFRTQTVPKFVTKNDCSACQARCRTELKTDFNEVKTGLKELSDEVRAELRNGHERFEDMAIKMAKHGINGGDK